MTVDLRKHAAGDIERLDELTGTHGFSYGIGEDSLAGITLDRDEWPSRRRRTGRFKADLRLAWLPSTR